MKLLFWQIICWISIFDLSAQTFATQLADSAFVLTKDFVLYDAAYFNISYPNGDVPKGKGVCTDVVRNMKKLLL